jgi:3-oxoacyl-[acyl-carrier protein] reductase
LRFTLDYQKGAQTMDLGLEGKVALVTAASRGLGAATALAFGREAAKVALCARNRGPLIDTCHRIADETGAEVLAVTADVSKAADVKDLVATTMDRFGRLDILVTNAGGPPAGNFLDLDEADWKGAVELTLMSAVRLCYAAVPAMREGGGGSILTIASMSVKQPVDNLILSNSLRLGVIGLVKSLSNELAPDGIRVNAICPGWTLTERVDELLSARAAKSGLSIEEEAAKITASIPLGRMADPEEFARAAVFLASPAATYITGVSLLVDGGQYKGAL